MSRKQLAITQIGILQDELGRTLKADLDRKSTRLNSSHSDRSRMPSSA